MTYTFTKTGSYHLERKEGNQDVVTHEENDRYAVITLADGVSSCTNGREGAEVASREMTRLLFHKAEHFMSFPEDMVAELSLAHIKWELKKCAEQLNVDIKELSSTLCSALYDRNTRKLLLINLGDGLIITGSKNGCAIPAMPSDSRNGCYVTTTPEAEKKMKVRKLDAGVYESIYLCSDGAWHNLFERSRMCKEVQYMIKNNRTEQLGDYLGRKETYDDCTFISMELRKGERKYS